MSTQPQETTAKKVGKKVYFWVAILYLLFMTDFLCRVGINAIFPTIQADLNLTDQQVGYMGSVVLLAMGICALPISFQKENGHRHVRALEREYCFIRLCFGIPAHACRTPWRRRWERRLCTYRHIHGHVLVP